MAEKKKKNTASNIIFALIIIIFLVLVVGAISIDSILRSAIEKAITKQLKVKASLAKVSLNIASGTVTAKDLKIGNPNGYQFENILELKSLSVKTSIGSLLSNPIEIEQIKLDDVALVIEQKGLTNNLNEILKSMPAKKAETKEPAANQKSVHITAVDINNISVTAKLLPVPGKSDAVTLEIASMHLSNIGGEKTSLADSIGKIFTAIANEVAAKGTGILPDDMVGSIQEGVGKTLESVGETGKQLMDKTKQDAQKGMEETTNKLKGLFEKKKD